MSFVDPLWEFVLDDYYEEEGNRRGRSKKRGDVKSSSGNRGFMANLTGSKNSKRVEYRDDEEDGFWDVITGAPPAATRPKRRSKSFSGRGRSLLSKKSTTQSTRSSSLTRSQSNLSEAEMSNNDKKKNGFKQRFSWNQNSKVEEDASMMEYSVQKLDVRHTSLSNDREDAESETFDPMDLLFHIADTLDPWGVDPSEDSTSDVDSNDGSATIDDDEGDGSSYIDSQYADESIVSVGFPDSPESQMSEVKSSNLISRSSAHTRNKNSSGKLGSLLDQQQPNPTTFDANRYPYHSKEPRKEENGDTTEIRLRVNPGGNRLSEEVYRTRNNTHKNSEQVVRKSPTWSEKRYPRYRQSFDSDALQAHQMLERASKQPDIDLEEERTISTAETSKPTFDEIMDPTNLGSESSNSIRDDDVEEFKIAKPPKVVKKAMCGLNKSRVIDSSDRLRRLPSSRVIVDGKIHSGFSPESDPMNGMLAASSFPFTKSKRPQSVFEYDYDSNMNMDVVYTKPNQKPRTSISVRKLGIPPPISSLLGVDDIVIQVEASIVSETDCIIRQGLWWGKSKPSFPNTPGTNMVGKIYSTKPTTGKVYGLKPMQTVISLMKWGGNTRFMPIHPKQLVKVPEGLDPAKAACLPECYLSAFQVLHMGQPGKSRYRESSMKGKSILILGSMTNNMGKAIIELALHAGAANVYATAKKKHWKTLISYGVMPLSPDPMDYIQRIAGTMHLVLAPNGNLREDVSPVHFRALIPKYGQLVISGRRIVGNDIPIDAWKNDHQAPTLVCGKNKAVQKILRNSISYDVYEEWEKNLDLCKKDLSYLLQLLEGNSIKPELLDRIPLSKVGKAHDLLETKRLPGFLVCEPWIKSKKHAVYL